MKLEMSVKVPETGSMEPEILGKLRNWFWETGFYAWENETASSKQTILPTNQGRKIEKTTWILTMGGLKV
jgi:hypothetical protein